MIIFISLYMISVLFGMLALFIGTRLKDRYHMMNRGDALIVFWFSLFPVGGIIVLIMVSCMWLFEQAEKLSINPIGKIIDFLSPKKDDSSM